MPARSGSICVIASVIALAGCGLDRAGLAAPRDAGLAPHDAGPPPIDAALPPIDAASPPVDAAAPPADAAPDAGTEPASDAGVDCREDADCPSEVIGDWGACTYPADPCAQTGSRSRVVRSYVCSPLGTCEASERAETEACARDTDGTYCGSPVDGPWSLCGGYESECDETGTQNRIVTQPVCAGGTCSGSITLPETQPCMRSTEGVACSSAGDSMCSDWSPCMPDSASASACSGTGVQTRTCTGAVCAGGMCSAAASSRWFERVTCDIDPSMCVGAISECGACAHCDGGTGFQRCKASIGACNPGGQCVGASSSVMVYQPCSCSVGGE